VKETQEELWDEVGKILSEDEAIKWLEKNNFKVINP